MTEDDLRQAMRKRFEAMSCREWSRLTGCNPTHVAEFVADRRGPPNDMLKALNLRVDYVKMRKAS